MEKGLLFALTDTDTKQHVFIHLTLYLTCHRSCVRVLRLSRNVVDFSCVILGIWGTYGGWYPPDPEW